MACAISISVPVNGSSLPRNRFRAPITSVRTRSGTAHMTWKPSPEACVAKTGQRTRLSAALACTARPEENASRHGPCAPWSSKSSSSRIRSSEEAISRSPPRASASITPAAAARRISTESDGQAVQEIDDVRSRWPAYPPSARRPGPARLRGQRPHPDRNPRARRGARRWSHSSNRTRRSTTFLATWYIERPVANAAARRLRPRHQYQGTPRQAHLIHCEPAEPLYQLAHTGRGVVFGDRRHDAGPPSVVPQVISSPATQPDSGYFSSPYPSKPDSLT